MTRDYRRKVVAILSVSAISGITYESRRAADRLRSRGWWAFLDRRDGESRWYNLSTERFGQTVQSRKEAITVNLPKPSAAISVATFTGIGSGVGYMLTHLSDLGLPAWSAWLIGAALTSIASIAHLYQDPNAKS